MKVIASAPKPAPPPPVPVASVAASVIHTTPSLPASSPPLLGIFIDNMSNRYYVE